MAEATFFFSRPLPPLPSSFFFFFFFFFFFPLFSLPSAPATTTTQSHPPFAPRGRNTPTHFQNNQAVASPLINAICQQLGHSFVNRVQSLLDHLLFLEQQNIVHIGRYHFETDLSMPTERNLLSIQLCELLYRRETQLAPHRPSQAA